MYKTTKSHSRQIFAAALAAVTGDAPEMEGSVETTGVSSQVQAGSPVRYITDADPPIMILHGESDQLSPHNQGEQLYMAAKKGCNECSCFFLGQSIAAHHPADRHLFR